MEIGMLWGKQIQLPGQADAAIRNKKYARKRLNLETMQQGASGAAAVRQSERKVPKQ
jgi:hypothetical protein